MTRSVLTDILFRRNSTFALALRSLLALSVKGVETLSSLSVLTMDGMRALLGYVATNLFGEIKALTG